MKKAVAFVLLVCLLLSTLPALAYPSLEELEQEGRSWAVVNNPNAKDRLHLRTGPGEKYESLGKYYNGTVVLLDGSEVKNGKTWYKVELYPLWVSGYMLGDYLAFGNDRQKVVDVRPIVTVTNPTGVKFRSGPSTSAAWIDKYVLPQGSTIQVDGMAGDDWLHILMENQPGYVMRKHTNFVDSRGQTEDVFAYVNNPDSADRLHLRKEASTDSISLGKYYNGTTVKLLGSPKRVGSDSWVQVAIESTGVTGYMQTAYLSQVPVKDVRPQSSVKSIGGVNLRQSASTSSKMIAALKQGTSLCIMGIVEGRWAHVAVDDMTGYVMLMYLNTATLRLP